MNPSSLPLAKHTAIPVSSTGIHPPFVIANAAKQSGGGLFAPLMVSLEFTLSLAEGNHMSGYQVQKNRFLRSMIYSVHRYCLATERIDYTALEHPFLARSVALWQNS